MRKQCGDKYVEFDLEPGVYTDWSSESATGKTYTAKLLDSLVGLGDNSIKVIKYDDVKLIGTEPYVKDIINNHFDIIFVDRANRYLDDNLYGALNNSNSIVFMDLKMESASPKYCGKECYIDMTPEGLRYYVDTV